MSEKTIKLTKWLQDYKDDFNPPVCNKLMHNEQLSVMFVGGPNQRYDYHFQIDEELFFMIKGDMKLPIVYKGSHIDIHIKEGEIFRLPARVCHSPQREADTIGLVMERRRHESEIDVLRYYVNGHFNSPVLYQKTMQVTDLGKDLPPVIKGYFASEEFKTRIPNPEADFSFPMPENLEDEIIMPYNYQKFLEENSKNIEKASLQGQSFDIFPARKDGKGLHVSLYGQGEYEKIHGDYRFGDRWIWMKGASGSIEIEGLEVCSLYDGDTKLVMQGKKVDNFVVVSGVAMVIYLPTRVED